ncbi:MAG: Protein translocase subunit SecA [Bryobacterales bacterium]|nr:Protein translocase subunit SecA [Bryobacterales bacterium]
MQPLTPTQEHVLLLLSTGSTAAAAAEAAGVHRNTIGHWRRTVPSFQQALAIAQYDRVLHWRDLAEENAAVAITTIREILADPKTPAGIRLKAALAILKECTTLPPQEPALENAAFNRNLATLFDPGPSVEDCAAAENSHNVHNSAQSVSAQPVATIRRATPKIGRNEPCPCASGRKHKHCCLNKTMQAAAA